MDAGYARLPGEDAEAHCARLLQLLGSIASSAEEDGSIDGSEAEGLEVAEAVLAQRSTEKQSPMVLELLKNLQQCAVPGMLGGLGGHIDLHIDLHFSDAVGRG